MAGGVSEYCASAMTPAGDTSFLIDVTPGANHSIVEEMLDYPRVVRSCSGNLRAVCFWLAETYSCRLLLGLTPFGCLVLYKCGLSCTLRA